MAAPSVESIVVLGVRVVAQSRHRPDSVLERHWWAEMGCRVKGLDIPARVQDRNERMLFREVCLVSAHRVD